jgi:hypothetical protein
MDSFVNMADTDAEVEDLERIGQVVDMEQFVRWGSCGKLM